MYNGFTHQQVTRISIRLLFSTASKMNGEAGRPPRLNRILLQFFS